MIKVIVKFSSHFIDKPLIKEYFLDENTMAVELEDGKQLKLGELPENILEQYFYKKYIDDTSNAGRVIDIKFTHVK